MPPRAISATVFVSLALAAASAAQAAPPCTHFDGNPLPPVDPTTYVYGTDDHDPDYLKVKYRKWEDYCYGDEAVWKEWHDENNWLDRKGNPVAVELSQRLDFYRRANQPLSPALPLVIFAHPNGPTEDVPDKLPQKRWVIMALVNAGYAVASVESRHPLGSIVAPRRVTGTDWPPVTSAPVPSDDIASAVRWLKFNSAAFGIDPARVVLVGQSRGSAVLLNALLNIPGDQNAVDWRSQSSQVLGAYAYQAQTSYVEDELAQVFVADQPMYRYWVMQDTPDAITPPGGDINRLPGSAAQLARTWTGSSLVPVHLSYDHETVLLPDGVHIKPQCFESNNRNRALEGFDNDDNPETPPVYELGGPGLPHCSGNNFDVHDPNYGQYLAQAYANHGASTSITRCGNVGEDNVKGGYADLLGFVDDVLAGRLHAPTCQAGGHVVPTPPPDTRR